MSDWETCAVSDSFVKNKVGRKNQIPAKDVAEVGSFPVVDQGQKFVAGYCEDGSKVIDFDLPLIIFGDHTRCFKYVDFPFVVGADGTKVIVPDKKLYDPKFYYFAMLALELPSRGYNRHFKILKERRLPLPPLPEQKKIAHILSTVQRAIEAQERIIQTTTELKKALMHKLFTEGLRNEPQKQTEIGLIPESWSEATLGELTTMRTGGTPSRKNKDFWEGGTIPWIKTGEVNYCEISTAEELITEAGLKGSNAKLFLKGTLLMAMYGQGITRGRVGTLGVEAATNQACAAITPNEEQRVSTEYLYSYFEYFYDELRARSHGANQKNLSMTLLKLFPVAFPDVQAQNAIVTAMKSVDGKTSLAKSRKTSLRDLFRTLLHELMTAKTRVHELELGKEAGA